MPVNIADSFVDLFVMCKEMDVDLLYMMTPWQEKSVIVETFSIR